MELAGEEKRIHALFSEVRLADETDHAELCRSVEPRAVKDHALAQSVQSVVRRGNGSAGLRSGFVGVVGEFTRHGLAKQS